MTDRYYALTVILERDIRSDDAEPMIEAIKMIRGVADVQPHISNCDLYTAQIRARNELSKEIWQVLHPGYKDVK